MAGRSALRGNWRSKACAITVAALVVVTGCAKTGGSSESGKVELGALLSLKGVYGAVGVPERNALKLGIKQINEDGGILGRKIHLTLYDDEGNQATAQQLAHRLAESDQVDAVIGPGITAIASVASPIFEKDKVLSIALTAQESLWKGKKYTFSAVPTDNLMAEAMLKYAKKKASGKKVAVGYSSVEYGVHGNDLILAELKKRGIKPTADEKWADEDVNFTPVVNRMLAGDPDSILLWGSGAPADAQMVKALRNAGYKGAIVGNTAYVNRQLMKVAGKSAESFIGISLIRWGNPQGKTKEFINNYKKRFGKLPTSQAAYTYDAIHRYKTAAEKAGSTDPTKVAKTMRSGLNFTSVQGKFHIDAENHVGTDDPFIYKPVIVRDGQWEQPKF